MTRKLYSGPLQLVGEQELNAWSVLELNFSLNKYALANIRFQEKSSSILLKVNCCVKKLRLVNLVNGTLLCSIVVKMYPDGFHRPSFASGRADSARKNEAS